MVLRNSIAFLLLCSLPIAAAEAPLSKLKKEQLEIDKTLDAKRASNLKYDWINPIVASYSYSASDQFAVENKSRYFRISLDQPIFKSGGIYFAIKYSDASKNFAKLTTSLREKSLIKSLYESVLNLQKLDLQMAKLDLEIQNAQIDILRKKEQFESGLIDSSFLDRAILLKSLKEQALLDSKQRHFALLQTFKTLSDIEYKEIKLPTFTLVSQEEFIEKNLQLQKLKAEHRQAKYLKNMTISNYLPTLSLFGEYSNKKDSFRLFKQNNESKNYGLRVSMPLFDVNRGRNIEIKKLEYLKSKLVLKDQQQEIENSFLRFKKDIEILNQREALAQKDVALYQSLVAVAEDGLRAGEKTQADVETLKNSQSIAKMDAKIYKIEIQEQFVALYAKMSDEI
jgi:outer membrane protein TolC